MRFMPDASRKSVYWSLVVLALLAAAVVFVGVPRDKSTVTIATATEGGTFYTIGKQLARVFEQQHERSYGRRGFAAVTSEGSAQNLELLLQRKADIALADEATLQLAARANPSVPQNVAVLARLFPSFVQIVLSRKLSEDWKKQEAAGGEKDPNPSRLEFSRLRREFPEGRLKLFVGAPRSGSRNVALELIRRAQWQQDEDYLLVEDVTEFNQAAEKLVSGEIDVGVFSAGIPTEAVAEACRKGCTLVRCLQENAVGKPTIDRIPAKTYENQPTSVRTLKYGVYLVCRHDCHHSLASVMEEALLDHLADLMLSQSQAAEVRADRIFDSLPEGFTFHRAVERIRAAEEAKLLIATGSLGGQYYQIGRSLQLILRQQGIPARLLQTDGSLENLRLLQNEKRPAIAIVQHDLALASLWDQPREVYKGLPQKGTGVEEWQVPSVTGLRRIAALHEEYLYAFASTKHPTIENLEDLRQYDAIVSLGPELSGTQLLAQAVLSQVPRQEAGTTSLGLELNHPRHHTVREMSKMLLDGDIAAGFAVGAPSNELLAQLLQDSSNIRAMPIPQEVLRRLEGPALKRGIYPRKLGETEREIPTLKTRAVLVANAATVQVYDITKALFEAATRLPGVYSIDTLKEDVASVPLHEDARDYYEDSGYLPRTEPLDYLALAGTILGLIATAVSVFTPAFVAVRYRSLTAKLIQRILGVELEERPPHAVQSLLAMQREIRDRARKKWWQPGYLTDARWRDLNDLIDQRIAIATKSLTRSLVREIGRVAGGSGSQYPVPRPEQIRVLAREYLERGELEGEQYEFLMKLLSDYQPAGAPPESPPLDEEVAKFRQGYEGQVPAEGS